MEIQKDNPTGTYSRREGERERTGSKHKTVILQEQFGQPNTVSSATPKKKRFYCYVKHLQRLMVLCCILAFIQSHRQNSVAEHFVILYSLSGLPITILQHLH